MEVLWDCTIPDRIRHRIHGSELFYPILSWKKNELDYRYHDFVPAKGLIRRLWLKYLFNWSSRSHKQGIISIPNLVKSERKDIRLLDEISQATVIMISSMIKIHFTWTILYKTVNKWKKKRTFLKRMYNKKERGTSKTTRNEKQKQKNRQHHDKKKRNKQQLTVFLMLLLSSLFFFFFFCGLLTLVIW